MSVAGRGSPIDPSTAESFGGLQVATGDVSLSPYPSTREQPEMDSKPRFTSIGNAAPPEMQNLREDRSSDFVFG